MDQCPSVLEGGGGNGNGVICSNSKFLQSYITFFIKMNCFFVIFVKVNSMSCAIFIKVFEVCGVGE